MSRIRTVKPDFFRHEALYEAEVASGFPLRIAFAGLFTVADREGRFRWRPRVIKLDVLPFDDVDFEAVLDALASREFIVRYEIDGEVYGHIPTFAKHQHVNQREPASAIPEPTEASTRTCENIPARVEGKGREGEEHTPLAGGASVEPQPPEEPKPAKPNGYPEEFEELWREYRIVGAPNATKADAFKSWKRLSKDDQTRCLWGLADYVLWVQEERKKRPDVPTKHLSTFINRRGWESFQEEDVNNAARH